MINPGAETIYEPIFTHLKVPERIQSNRTSKGSHYQTAESNQQNEANYQIFLFFNLSDPIYIGSIQSDITP